MGFWTRGKAETAHVRLVLGEPYALQSPVGWVRTGSVGSRGPSAASADQQCHPHHLRQLLWQPGAPSATDRLWGSPTGRGCLRPHPAALPVGALPVHLGQHR